MPVPDGFLARRVLRDYGNREVNFGQAFAVFRDHPSILTSLFSIVSTSSSQLQCPPHKAMELICGNRRALTVLELPRVLVKIIQLL